MKVVEDEGEVFDSDMRSRSFWLIFKENNVLLHTISGKFSRRLYVSYSQQMKATYNIMKYSMFI